MQKMLMLSQMILRFGNDLNWCNFLLDFVLKLSHVLFMSYFLSFFRVATHFRNDCQTESQNVSCRTAT